MNDKKRGRFILPLLIYNGGVYIDTLNITIDKNVLEKYYQFYFKLHPRASKKPIEHPYHPSINVWMIMKRPMMNRLKSQWKDFIVWLIKYLGYENLYVDTCNMTFITYFPTKARHDVDNQSPKFILDGLTESGFIVDDDSKHLKSLTLECAYDKENPRTEIFVRDISLAKQDEK